MKRFFEMIPHTPALFLSWTVNQPQGRRIGSISDYEPPTDGYRVSQQQPQQQTQQQKLQQYYQEQQRQHALHVQQVMETTDLKCWSAWKNP